MNKFYLLGLSLMTASLAALAQPSAANVFNGKAISQVSDGTTVTTFTYNDAMQLMSVVNANSYSQSTATFNYASGSYEGNAYDAVLTISDPGETLTCYLVIGDNGFVSKCYEVETSEGEAAENETYTFEYSDDGHLTKISELGLLYNETVSMAYDNGDIVTAEKRGDDYENITIAYSSASAALIDNVGGLMDFDSFGFDNVESTYLYYAGLLGKPTKHLPISSTEKIQDGGSSVSSFRWTLDADGYPIVYKEYEDGLFAESMSIAWTDIAGITDVASDSNAAVAAYYDITGQRHAQPVAGLNIVKHTDGSTAKVLIR